MMSLMELKATGVGRVDIVAHSMGGLVARDVLTRRAYYAGDGAGDEGLPAVDRLIMCGTPNHGSSMARLRAISGIGEQISRAFSGEGGPAMGQSDGSGEAAIDLMPGSAFLRDLNHRPLAGHTRHTIIAGRISPVTQGQLTALSRRIKEAARAASAPRWLRDWIASADEETSEFLKEAVRGLGDGCVTIDSARLEGVGDFVILEANHVSLIVNLVESSNTTPPAIPLILARLGEAGEPVEPQAKD
jgi:pimeloyl-ACP methyl ester carboxylesterase